MARVRNIIPVEQWPAHHREGLDVALQSRRRHNKRRKRFNWKAVTKYGTPYDPILPQLVVELLARFQHHRGVLTGAPYEGRLWLFSDGSPQSARSINYHICKETKKVFGRSMCPHLFRDAVNTTVATYMPEHVRMGLNLLGNRDLACTDEHYYQAERHVANQKYNRTLDDYEDAA